MLRSVLILIAVCILLPILSFAGGSEDLRTASADTAHAPAIGDSDLRDAWFRRHLSALLARRPPDEEAAVAVDPARVRDRFLPHAGRRIREIRILGREAFGSIDVEDRIPVSWVRNDSLVTRTKPFEKILNSLAALTDHSVIRHFLLFREGGPVVPAALADSERLLREQTYIRDALILVFPLDDRPDLVDIVVLVRDRWPWGVQVSVKDHEEQQMAVFHRNAGGYGLNLEMELLVDRAERPATGWRHRADSVNVAGTFVDLSLNIIRTWDRDLTGISAARGFSYPDIRLLGGWSIFTENWKALPQLPPGQHLSSRIQDIWLGWNIPLRPVWQYDKRRLRLVPAVRMQHVDYRGPTSDSMPFEQFWVDRELYLLQLSLSGIDHYTTGLVYGYGETEVLPVGFWTALVAGVETTAAGERLYHGMRIVWPSFLVDKRYLTLDAAVGGFRRGGRFEDGVLDVGLTTFSPLRQRRHGAWRHFFQVRYTLGIDPDDALGLRLDAAALRDLDDPVLSGNQRLVAQLESVLFTNLAVFGFNVTAFGYADCGKVSRQREPLFSQRLHADLGFGIRLNNPGLVLPTIEARLGALHAQGIWQPAVTVRMGEIKFVRQRMPGVQPGLLPYQ